MDDDKDTVTPDAPKKRRDYPPTDRRSPEAAKEWFERWHKATQSLAEPQNKNRGIEHPKE